MQLHHNYATLGYEFFAHTQIQPLLKQRLVQVNQPLADDLNIDLTDDLTLKQLSGEVSVDDSLSMVYAGHQFGGFTPRLGDGRGVLLGEVYDQQQRLHDIHIKGAGQTPFSRQGDGRAVLRSSIREYLASEYMHGLGIPTSRALALYTSEQAVYRERPETGALLVRTARTHIRFGHFEYFFAHKKFAELQQLIDYSLDTYFAHLKSHEQPIKAMLIEIVERTARLIAQWQSVGFQHGVMNTDNFSILGETIDYGPYGFMEDFNDTWVCNHSDYEGRYAFHRQPGIGLWNLNCLMHAFSNHLSRDELIEVLKHYEPCLQQHYNELMAAKLGIQDAAQAEALLEPLYSLMRREKLDFTLFFRLLSKHDENKQETLLDEVVDRKALADWLNYYWSIRNDGRDQATVKTQVLRTNPKFVLRNYLAHQAIESAESGNYIPLKELLNVLESPFDEHPESESLAQRAPDWGRDLAVSCSS
ncbi:protein adenylyltransferase SelO [Marinomonas ostreistagni]|uniref:protein adenylyltransferase SelO n=1 Tax=Marinomonas ostreistagni TaxID=359209 RepID=UPI00194FC0F7|nr:YdiU family protein [Marinomonas ostreistagni]MBM6550188.1 YdiU family protein [Marinomonas ostreistagni]